MNRISLLFSAAALSIAVTASADRYEEMPALLSQPKATTDPMIPIYRASGVRDNGGAAGTGIATSIHCTNIGGDTETLKYIVRNFDSSVKSTLTLNIGSAQTRTASTHDTVMFAEDIILNTGVVNQGNVTVTATSTNIYCSIMLVDASAAVPVGVSLHAVRFNPMVGAESE